MRILRTMCLFVLLLAVVPGASAQKKDRKGPQIDDKTFRQIAALLINDPLHRSGPDWSRLILLYTLQTSNAAVSLGSEEFAWVALDKDDEHGLLLLAGYVAGNIQSQLNSGVKRNDRYSGLLTLFQVYRSLQKNDAKFRITDVENLLTLHEEDKLVSYLQKTNEKKPAKMTPQTEALIRKLLDRK